MAYPAKTTEGETVTIVEKRIVAPDTPTSSTLLVADDGRTFAPAKGGLIEEITAIIEEGVESVVETVKETGAELVDKAAELLGMGNDEEPAPGTKPEDDQAA